ncbi:MAG TPA: o-succinylbenzoate synthase [Polyangiaceae bacterium]|nr:o-succinylbenzoate synthase [Polyangiaceae bacterium]
MTWKARLSRYRLPLGGTVRTARAAWHERSGAILTIEDGRGGFGQGEAAPLPGYSDETLAEAERQLGALDLALLEAALTRAVDEPHLLGPALRQTLPNALPSARFALETAAFDWLARRRDEPLHALLARLSATSSDAAGSLPLAALLESDDPIASAERAVTAGFASLKLKVGLPGREHEELALIQALRARFDPQLRIRLDANGAWTHSVARERLKAFAAFGIEFIEEPTAFGETPLIAPAVAVALDETLRRAPLPARAELAERRVTALVLKPTVLGGLLTTLELAQKARIFGCASVFSHCFEGPIAYRATCELALTLGTSAVAQGLAPHSGLTAWPVPSSTGAATARLARHQAPGLGLGSIPLEVPP